MADSRIATCRKGINPGSQRLPHRTVKKPLVLTIPLGSIFGALIFLLCHPAFAVCQRKVTRREHDREAFEPRDELFERHVDFYFSDWNRFTSSFKFVEPRLCFLKISSTIEQVGSDVRLVQFADLHFAASVQLNREEV